MFSMLVQDRELREAVRGNKKYELAKFKPVAISKTLSALVTGNLDSESSSGEESDADTVIDYDYNKENQNEEGIENQNAAAFENPKRSAAERSWSPMQSTNLKKARSLGAIPAEIPRQYTEEVTTTTTSTGLKVLAKNDLLKLIKKN